MIGVFGQLKKNDHLSLKNMTQKKQRYSYLLLVIFSTLFVYAIGHYCALTNPHVINDDVRQQIYWMQRWQDPELFQDDVVTRYAENYVPIGVKSIYYVFSWIMNPVQFSKALTGFLFVINGVLLFLIGTRFADDFTALVFATCSFLFTSFISKISGGMSQSFAYPMMLAYLYFLASENLFGASVTIMIQSIFNPYIFVLCALTHALFLLKNYGMTFLEWIKHFGSDQQLTKEMLRLILLNAPVLIGVSAMIVQHVFMRTQEFGDLISWLDIYGHIEYTASGRYQLAPGPDLLWEIFRPVVLLVLFDDYGLVAGTISGALCLLIVFWAIAINKWSLNLSKLWFLGYFIAASIILYFVSYEIVMRLFLPRRYVEFSFNLIYVIILAACVSSIINSLDLGKFTLFCLLLVIVVMGGLRIHNVGIYDYSRDTKLYEFVADTPKNVVFAGPPEVMDNVVTFGKRKAFVTFELSHTWFREYWKIIKQRTFDFFDAYYSPDPKEVLSFAKENNIDYLIIREKDFEKKNISKSFKGFEPFGSDKRSIATAHGLEEKSFMIYFEPFQTYITNNFKNNSYFAVLDENFFKPVFRGDGYRVIKLR